MRKLSFALIILGSLTFSGCALQNMMKLAKDQNLQATPDPLEVHADTVKFEMSATLPVKMLKPKLTYEIEPKYEYAGKEYALETVAFNAAEYPNADAQKPKIVKEFAFPYADEMAEGKVTIQGYGKHENGKQVGPTEKLDVVSGIITTSRLVEEAGYAAIVSYDYKDSDVDGWTPEEELEPTNIPFYFMQGSSVLRLSEKTSDRGKFFQAFIAEKNVTRTVTITGTHSPEGAERFNSKLAENRAKIIEDYYRSMMDKYDYKGAADSIKFVLKPVIEDWNEFKQALNDYDGIDQSAKSEILSIVNGPGTFEEKEDALHKLSSYKKIFKDIYPDLRTAKTEILTVVPKRSAAEISVLAKQIVEGKVPADTLSYGELAYAAYLTPSTSEKVAIYEATVKTYDNWAAHNNLGAAYLVAAMDGTGDKNEMLEKAVTQFEISAKKKSTSYATGNLGVAEYQQGNVDKAMDDIKAALGMNPPSKVGYGLNGVKGAIEIKKAKYSDAVKSLSASLDESTNLFNKGLAQVLAKDYQNAMVTLDELAEKDSEKAMGYYVAAIAAANSSKEAEVVSNITKAVELDPELKQKALKDLEFRNFWNVAAFKEAMN